MKFNQFFNFNSRAQGTIEYLVIIAIVVVISLVVVALMLGIFENNSDVTSTAQNIQTQTLPVALNEAIIGNGNDANGLIVLTNNTGDIIKNVRITIDEKDHNYYDIALSQGNKVTFKLNSLHTPCLEGQEKISKTITITYTTRAGLEKKQTIENVTLQCAQTSEPISTTNPKEERQPGQIIPNCTENWSCTWGACINGNQTGTCTDLSNCGTTIYKPQEQRACTLSDTTPPELTNLTSEVDGESITLTFRAWDNNEIKQIELKENDGAYTIIAATHQGSGVGDGNYYSILREGLGYETQYTFYLKVTDFNNNTSPILSVTNTTGTDPSTITDIELYDQGFNFYGDEFESEAMFRNNGPSSTTLEISTSGFVSWTGNYYSNIYHRDSEDNEVGVWELSKGDEDKGECRYTDSELYCEIPDFEPDHTIYIYNYGYEDGYSLPNSFEICAFPQITDTDEGNNCQSEVMEPSLVDVLKTGLIGYWPMDESSGNMIDYSGNNVSATRGSLITMGQPGVLGNAYLFNNSTNGSTNAIVLPNNLITLQGTRSISFWFKSSNIDASNAHPGRGLYYLGQTGTNGSQFFVLSKISPCAASNGQINIYSGSVGNQNVCSGAISYTNGTWMHVVMTHGSNSTKIYVNGTLRVTANQNFSIMTNTSHTFGWDPRHARSALYETFDEFAMWNRVLTQEEVTALYNFGSGLSLQ